MSPVTTTQTPLPPTFAVRIAPTVTATAAQKLAQTPKPTKTTVPSATYTLVPTYTPATHSQFSGTPSYHIHEWTEDQAAAMVNQVLSHIKAVEAIATDTNDIGNFGDSYYMGQYQYLGFAESEALLRSPDALQAEFWRWDRCYNLALSYPYAEATDAPELVCYAKLIEDGLNSGQTNPSNLPKWFQAHESRFSFEITSQTQPPSYTSSYMITLEGNALLWLLERDGRFQVTGLRSSMFFHRESGLKFQFMDLTGDHNSELILYFGRSYCCGGFSTQFIYDLSSGTPRELTINNLKGTQSNLFSDYDSYVTVLNNETSPGFVFKSHYGNPLDEPCDLRQYEKYYWNNDRFELATTWYGVEPPSEYEDQELCMFAIDKPTNQNEIDVVAHVIRQVNDRHLPGFQQIIPFRLGEYYARLGNYEKARQFFSEAALSSSKESKPEWSQAAQTILQHYKLPDDFYQSCSAVPQCDMDSVIQQTIENIKPDLFPTVAEILQSKDLPVKANGIFDFDLDGLAEQWIVLQRPGKNEHKFWLLIENPNKINAIFLADVPSNGPDLRHIEVGSANPLTELKTQTGRILFSLQKIKLTGQPYILQAKSPQNPDNEEQQAYVDKLNFWEQALGQAAMLIFSGADLGNVKETLSELRQSKNYDCETYKCDQLYYLLGITNELTDDPSAAVDAYLQLWNTYPDSPYTIMARSKLQLAP